MGFDFLKKMFGKDEPKKEEVRQAAEKTIEKAKPVSQEVKEQVKTEIKEKIDSKIEPAKSAAQTPVKADNRPVSEKTDEELEKELINLSPEILAQAKTPEMKKMVIKIYRRMLEDKVDINDDKEVKKWLKKHPEVSQGGEPAAKVETYVRTEDKVGRNEPCPCGSGKKYKKCCGKE